MDSCRLSERAVDNDDFLVKSGMALEAAVLEFGIFIWGHISSLFCTRAADKVAICPPQPIFVMIPSLFYYFFTFSFQIHKARVLPLGVQQ